VIVAYLDGIGDAPPLIPDAPDRWPVLAGQALGDGMLDALFALVMERRRPESERSAMWQARWRQAFLGAADTAEAGFIPFEAPLTVAQIALGCALGYADFRTPDIDWRTGRPRLAAFFGAFASRDAMRETAPPA
jgi:glutathione S-transferase